MENVPVTIRQVPGDGNCLFHSLSVGLNYVETKRHLYMKNEIESPWDDIDYKHNDYNSNSGSNNNNYHHDSLTLHERSALLRQIAVDMLIPNDDADDDQENDVSNNSQPMNTCNDQRVRLPIRKNRKRHRRRRKPLFIQGNEYLHVDDLLQLAGSQYDLTGMEYCKMMRKKGVWGGGPEIVALCNYLKRPIHVYELVTVHPPPASTRTLKYSQFRNGMLALSKGILKKENGKDYDADINNMYQTKQRSKIRTSRLCKGSNPEFRLRRMACFGSPKYDYKEPIHILSADCRFPDLKPGQEASNGNHFLAIFPFRKGCLYKSSPKLSSSVKQRGVKVRSGASKSHPSTEKYIDEQKMVKGNDYECIFGGLKMLSRWLNMPSYSSLIDEWMRAIQS